MKKNILGAVAATFAVALGTTGAQATGFLQPGQFMGLAIGAPLPEGVFFSDLESYGKSDNSKAGVGVNIPIVSWSTPFSFYNTRLIVSYSAPFLHQDGPATRSNFLGGSRVDFISEALGFTLAHSFGNGFSASLSAFARSPDVYFHDYTGGDIFAGFSYTANGFSLDATVYYSGTFGSHEGTPKPLATLAALSGVTGSSDFVGVDFTAAKKFGALELGLVGFAYTDTDTRLDNTAFNIVGFNPATGTPVLQGYSKRAGAVALGGLVGYNFGRFSLQGMVTREIGKRNAFNGPSEPLGLFGNGERETRGWLRLIVPLYVAPAPPAPVVARF